MNRGEHSPQTRCVERLFTSLKPRDRGISHVREQWSRLSTPWRWALVGAGLIMVGGLGPWWDGILPACLNCATQRDTVTGWDSGAPITDAIALLAAAFPLILAPRWRRALTPTCYALVAVLVILAVPREGTIDLWGLRWHSVNYRWGAYVVILGAVVGLGASGWAALRERAAGSSP